MGDSKTITIETTDGPVVVRKLALGDYAELLKKLRVLPKRFSSILDESETDLKDMKNEDFIPQLLPVIADSIPELCGVLAVTTDKDEKFFLEGDLSTAVEVFVAALELNDYSQVRSSIKKLTARKQPQDHKPKGT